MCMLLSLLIQSKNIFNVILRNDVFQLLMLCFKCNDHFTDTYRIQVVFHQSNTTKYDVFLNDAVISLNSILPI